MKFTNFTLLFLLVFGVTAVQPAALVGGPSERCLCPGKLLIGVKLSLVRNVSTFPPSPYCPNTEIVITFKKSGKKICLDPDGIQGRRILEGKRRKKPNKPQQGRKQKKRQQSASGTRLP